MSWWAATLVLPHSWSDRNLLLANSDYQMIGTARVLDFDDECGLDAEKESCRMELAEGIVIQSPVYSSRSSIYVGEV
eukprot:7097499-Pyramimonas_sp.AAC.1